MRPEEIIEERERLPLIYLPIGPLEWHGPHLPLGTDPLHAREVAIGLAKKLGGVVLPPYFIGTERERKPEMLESIGFKKKEWIVGMDFPENSHIAVIDRLAAEFNHQGRMRVVHFLPIMFLDGDIGHATRTETSIMSKIYPSSVKIDALPPLPHPLKNVKWAIVDDDTFKGNPSSDFTVKEKYDPRKATSKEGSEKLKREIEMISKELKKGIENLTLLRK
jgi:creatinine amidohydrolase